MYASASTESGSGGSKRVGRREERKKKRWGKERRRDGRVGRREREGEGGM